MNKLIITFICLFGAAALGAFMIYPEYQNLAPKQKNIKEKTFQLESQKEYYLEIDKIAKDLEGYPEELSKIEAAFPEDFSLPSMYNYLQKKASEAGLILKSATEISNSAQTEGGRIKEHFMRLSLSGSYDAIKNFTLIMENSARLIEVREISFSSPAAKNSPISSVITLKFATY